MDIFGTFKVSASALYAQRERMNIIASNMANVHTTRTEDGGPYKKKDVLFQSFSIDPDNPVGPEGVEVVKVIEDNGPPLTVYDPGHPDANDEGYVDMPNIKVIEEMVNMMMASRTYEANVSTFNLTKGMFIKTLDIGR